MQYSPVQPYEISITIFTHAANVRSRYPVETESFEGCLRNFNIYRDGRKLEVLIFSQAQEHENVEFDICRYT